METIKQILIRRDNMSPQAADNLIQYAKEQLQEYLISAKTDPLYFELAEDICAEFFGLAPDYLYELL